jgi:signal transduction histidine kinase
MGDKNAITTVFLNIIDNAIKFTQKNGNITIEMRTEANDFRANITNSFEKIDQKSMEKIFNPFGRAIGSDIPGSGLGLAITKKILTNLGGSISASNSEEGFMIQIILPLRQ